MRPRKVLGGASQIVPHLFDALVEQAAEKLIRDLFFFLFLVIDDVERFAFRWLCGCGF
jgi:hypothetical protein